MLVHVEQPVERRRRPRARAPKRIAWRKLGELRVRFDAQRCERGAGVPAARLVVGGRSAKTQTSSDQSACSSAAGRRVEQRRQRRRRARGRGPGRSAAPARPRGRGSRTAARRRSSSRRRRRAGPSPATASGADWLLRTPSAAAMPISGADAACQAARGPAGASRPGKPASRAPVAIAPLVGASKPSSIDQRDADRDREQGAAAQRRPRLARADREERRGAQPPGRAGGVEQAARGPAGRRLAAGNLRGLGQRGSQLRSCRWSRHLRRPRGGSRLLPLPLRAAAGARLPLGGHRRLRQRARRRRLAPRPRPQPALRRQLLGDLHPPRPHRHRARLDPAGPQGAADQDLGGADHRHGRPLRRLALRHPAQPRVARRRPARARRQGRPDRRRRRLRDRLDALHRPHPRRDPLRRRRSRTRPPAAPSSSPSTRPAWRSPSCSPPSPSPA